MQMPNRSYSASGSYRYGFNGKENDNEVKGAGNQQDYGMRIYDPRISRFLSVDPVASAFAWNSTYSFAENEPISNIDLDGLEKAKSTSAGSIIGQGLKQGWQETKDYWSNFFSRKTVAEAKATANDIYKTYAKGDPNAIRSFNKRVFSASMGVSNTMQAYSTQPVMWFLGINDRSREENLKAIGYGLWKAGELFVIVKVPEVLEGGEGVATNKRAQVDLMGGKASSLGRPWINFDKAATKGIADDVANFGKHFGKNTVAEIVVNNPQAEFLQHVTDALEEGGTITVRGNLSNKYFKSIYNGKAKGLENFEVTEVRQNVPNQGYTTTGGEDIRGEIHEIRLTKKTK